MENSDENKIYACTNEFGHMAVKDNFNVHVTPITDENYVGKIDKSYLLLKNILEKKYKQSNSTKNMKENFLVNIGKNRYFNFLVDEKKDLKEKNSYFIVRVIKLLIKLAFFFFIWLAIYFLCINSKKVFGNREERERVKYF